MMRDKIEILKDKILKYETQYNIIRNKADIKYDELLGLKVKLQELCSCNDETYLKEEYIPGDYYDKSKNIKRWYCKTCNKLLNEEIKIGYYG